MEKEERQNIQALADKIFRDLEKQGIPVMTGVLVLEYAFRRIVVNIAVHKCKTMGINPVKEAEEIIHLCQKMTVLDVMAYTEEKKVERRKNEK